MTGVKRDVMVLAVALTALAVAAVLVAQYGLMPDTRPKCTGGELAGTCQGYNPGHMGPESRPFNGQVVSAYAFQLVVAIGLVALLGAQWRRLRRKG